MRALLDINILIALLDGQHADHARARDWLGREIQSGWASCALTQNGFIRIVSQPSYVRPFSVREATILLSKATGTEHHEFWGCRVSLLDHHHIDLQRILGPSQINDVYLLALAVAHGGRFVTFDRKVPLSAVPAATERNLVVL
jgi:uncharacterized protein